MKLATCMFLVIETHAQLWPAPREQSSVSPLSAQTRYRLHTLLAAAIVAFCTLSVPMIFEAIVKNNLIIF